MSTASHITRQKISTTIAPESFDYLNQFVAAGEARNLADAIDLVINRLKEFENRERCFALLVDQSCRELRRCGIPLQRVLSPDIPSGLHRDDHIDQERRENQ